MFVNQIITDGQNQCDLDNLEGFKEHRHDQSVLSILAIKNEIQLHRDPSQYGMYWINDTKWKDSNYGTVLRLHRDRNSRKNLFFIYDYLTTTLLALTK